ncbi:type II secretion system protein [bacterium]|nr:type II secretion system protein [bacterium]
MKKFLAFTLAETLIVIGVIGIVSALTLPNLNSSTGDKERVAKVKKIYQNLNDAFSRAQAVYGSHSEWFVNDGNDASKIAKRTGERITEFMKTSKTCGISTNQGCFTGGIDNDAEIYKFITADGMSIAIRPDSTEYQHQIRIDIDGPTKGSLTSGLDYFMFNIENNNIVPKYYNDSFNDLVNHSYNGGLGAATWIIRYDNADYLQFTNNTGTCKNGNTVTEANPRCK